MKIDLLDEMRPTLIDVKLSRIDVEILQLAMEMIEMVETKNKSQTPQSSNNYQANKFLSIELVKFYGEIDKWPQFRD